MIICGLLPAASVEAGVPDVPIMKALAASLGFEAELIGKARSPALGTYLSTPMPVFFGSYTAENFHLSAIRNNLTGSALRTALTHKLYLN